MVLCCQPFSDSQSDLWCASCSRLSVTALTEERQMLSSQKHQVAGSAAVAFMHGAQDGQKFLGVLLLGLFLVNGQSSAENVMIPIWMMILCTVVMGLGTSIGGK